MGTNTGEDMSTGEPYGLSSARHECWGTLLHVHAQATERIAKRVEAESGIPLDWYDVLLALEKAPEGCLRMGELVEHVTLSRSGLTRLVDRIEAAGLVERRLCRQDRRAFEAVLTSKGQQVREKCWPILARVISQEFGERYSNEEAAQLSALLKRQLREHD